jgi:hypothetical protein
MAMNFTVSTFPTALTVNVDFSVTLDDELALFSDAVTYTLEADEQVFTDYVISLGGEQLTFTGVQVGAVGVVPVVVTGDDDNSWSFSVTIEAVCFRGDTQLTVVVDGVQAVARVDCVRKGDMVVTTGDNEGSTGLVSKAVEAVLAMRFYPTAEGGVNGLYRVGELVVTGGHSILSAAPHPTRQPALDALFGGAGRAKLGGMWKVPAMFHEESELVQPAVRSLTVHHFALEHPDPLAHYAVTASGQSTESMSRACLNQYQRRQKPT